MPAMKKQVQQRAGEQEDEGERAEYVRGVLGQQKEAGHREKADQRESRPRAQKTPPAPFRPGFVCGRFPMHCGLHDPVFV